MKLAIANLKGGVGKSSVAQNLAVFLSSKGFKVCIVDTDIDQQTSVRWSGQRESGAKVTVVGISDQKALAKNIQQLEQDYDWIIIDGSPVLGALASHIILVSDLLIIPILPGVADIWSLENFLERLEQARTIKGDIPAYVLINKFNSSEKKKVTMDIEVEETLKNSMGVQVLNAKLHYRVAYREAMIGGMTAYEGKDAKARKEIESLGKEILKIVHKMK